jgi:ADP-ribose pyrophosphatase
MSDQLREKTLKTELVFSGKFLHIWRDDVELPDGQRSFREYIKHPGAALIVPVRENGDLVMIRQYRHAVGQVFLEFPAGKADRGETTDQTARRELREEVGYQAGQLEKLTRIHPVIGYSNEFIDLYVARNLQATATARDADELLEIVEMPFAELMERIWKGEVSDVKTQLAAFWYARWANEETRSSPLSSENSRDEVR